MRNILILAAAFAVASPALAGTAVTLKSETVTNAEVVTLGDLFDGAGAASGVPVATKSSATLILDAAAVQLAARRAGLDWADAEGIRRIVVRGGAPAAANGQRGNVEILTFSRSLAAGEIVQPTDLVWSKAAAAPGDAPSNPDAVIGLAARHPLRAGAPVSIHDVAAAQVIKAGDIITVTYDADGITLTLQGKATASGGAGETITVQNTASRTIIQAVITGPGQAVVGPLADKLKSIRSTRYAAR